MHAPRKANLPGFGRGIPKTGQLAKHPCSAALIIRVRIVSVEAIPE